MQFRLRTRDSLSRAWIYDKLRLYVFQCSRSHDFPLFHVIRFEASYISKQANRD